MTNIALLRERMWPNWCCFVKGCDQIGIALCMLLDLIAKHVAVMRVRSHLLVDGKWLLRGSRLVTNMALLHETKPAGWNWTIDANARTGWWLLSHDSKQAKKRRKHRSRDKIWEGDFIPDAKDSRMWDYMQKNNNGLKLLTAFGIPAHVCRI